MNFMKCRIMSFHSLQIVHFHRTLYEREEIRGAVVDSAQVPGQSPSCSHSCGSYSILDM